VIETPKEREAEYTPEKLVPPDDSPAMAWFRAMQQGDAGVRARLRRARSRTEVLMEPRAIELAQRTGRLARGRNASDEEIGAALDLARVLAHVKEHDGTQRLMQRAGWRRFAGDRRESDAGDDRPTLSGVRFRRLLTTEGGEPLVAAFTRLVRQLDGIVNVGELASDFLDWTHPTRGARIRRKWAFDYFAASNPVSSSINPSTDHEDDS
jgi:CRISPR type I-E-associated protein CasB/Cse2